MSTDSNEQNAAVAAELAALEGEGADSAPQQPASFTQADLDRVAAQAKAKAERQAARLIEQKVAEAQELAKLGDTERLQREAEGLKAQLAEAKAQAAGLERKMALTGHVADVNIALAVLRADHLDENGAVDVEALLSEFPILRPSAGLPPVAGSAPTPGAAAAQQTASPSLEAAIKSGSPEAVLAAFNAQMAAQKRR